MFLLEVDDFILGGGGVVEELVPELVDVDVDGLGLDSELEPDGIELEPDEIELELGGLEIRVDVNKLGLEVILELDALGLDIILDIDKLGLEVVLDGLDIILDTLMFFVLDKLALIKGAGL